MSVDGRGRSRSDRWIDAQDISEGATTCPGPRRPGEHRDGRHGGLSIFGPS